jgi:CheY-like chemotaxis protein
MSTEQQRLGHAQKQRLILLVDDDELITKLVSAILVAGGYAVRSASSGQMALDMLQAGGFAPDLALLDVNMPGMSGLQLAEHLQLGQRTPFMFLSSEVDIDTVAQATGFGAVGYLVKPIVPGQLIPSISAALARADDIVGLRGSEGRLTKALNAGRETDIAIGVLMERYRVDRDTALRVLRDYARAHQRKLGELVVDVVAAAELLNDFSERFSWAPRR